jgi:hypothetical protein
LVAFIVYITTKGELPRYLSLLFGPVTAAPGSGGSGVSPSSSGSTSSASGALGTAGQAAGVAQQAQQFGNLVTGGALASAFDPLVAGPTGTGDFGGGGSF